MDIKVSLKLLLSNNKDTFTLAGPCVCCGQPHVSVWNYRKAYNLERWVSSSKGNRVRQGYQDKDGKSAQGDVELNLPYCSDHYNQTKRLHNYHSKQQNGAIIAGVIAIVLYFVFIGGDWIGAATTNVQVGFRACAMPIIVFLGILGLGFAAFVVFNERKATQPEFIDYPIDSNEGGGCGLAIRVEGEESGSIGQHLKYFLNLDFKNGESAKQFKQEYPRAMITRGKELLE